MVLTLLYLLLKKIRKQGWARTRRYISFRLFNRSNQTLATLLLLLLLMSVFLVAQKTGPRL